MSKRIDQLPIISAIKENDYVAVDNSNDGSRKILASLLGGGGGTSTKVDIFDGASTITPTHSVGITVSTSSVSDMTGAISGSEWSDGYEGFNIALKNLTVGEGYMINFNFQFSNTAFFEGMYRVGYLLNSSNRTDYDDYTKWEDNLDRDLVSHRHKVSFVASASTMYLCFNLCGCSDGQTNYWSISDFYVKTASGGSSDNYSTTEQEVGTWIDGSPVYQRTFVGQGVNVGGYVILDATLLPSNVSFLEKAQVSAHIDSSVAPNLYTDTINGGSIEVAVGSIGLYLENYGSYDITDFTVTVRYAKTSS